MPELLGCFCLPPFSVILEPLLQLRTGAKLFISFLYRLLKEKREIGTGTEHNIVVKKDYESAGPNV
jgi:hypothetical protein